MYLLSEKRVHHLPPLLLGVGFLGYCLMETSGRSISRGPHGRMRYGEKLYFQGITPLSFQSSIPLSSVIEEV